MCGDLIERLTVEACEIAAPIIHSQRRGENHDLPAHTRGTQGGRAG